MSRGRKPNQTIKNDWESVFWNNLASYIGIFNKYLFLESYKFEKVKNILDKLSFTIPKGLKSKGIESQGNYPVISQSKEFIIGYSDKSELLVKESLPLIIFGDHSKTIKYVDIPFIIGADGVKLLKPKKYINEKFFYFFLFGVITYTKDYGRHFKLIKEGSIPIIKDMNLQKSVVFFLQDLKNNKIKSGVVYFNSEIEKKIVLMHQNQVDGTNLSTELTHQLSLVKKLRQAFLREAMQGKLVEQNPNDEPATKLLAKIKAEKEQLIKEKKIKKQKPLPPITKEEIPFEIPDGWVWCRLGEIYQTTSGGTPSRNNSEYWNGDIIWYKSGELNDDHLLKPAKEKITELGLKKSSANLFPKGTLLIAMYGATAGKLAILENVATTNQAVCGFYKNSNVITEYLFYFFMANRSKMIKESWGMSQPNISQTYLRNFIFPLPPLSEQKHIVAKLDELMSYCDNLEESIKNSQKQNEMLLGQVLREALEPTKEAGKPKEKEVVV